MIGTLFDYMIIRVVGGRRMFTKLALQVQTNIITKRMGGGGGSEIRDFTIT